MSTHLFISQHELNCRPCDEADGMDCRRCYFAEVPEVTDKFFHDVVQPYTWLAAVLLFLSYVIGLWFTLRTHAAIIWTSEHDEKKPVPLQRHGNSSVSLQGQHVQPQVAGDRTHGSQEHRDSIRTSNLYARILAQSLTLLGLAPNDDQNSQRSDIHVVPPKGDERAQPPSLALPGLSEEQNRAFVRQVTEVAATAATVAARDATRKKNSNTPSTGESRHHSRHHTGGSIHAQPEETDPTAVPNEQHHPSPPGGHDAPNWSKTKSAVILLVATLGYAIIAEILVNTVDVVLESVDVDEKFLGITLFSLVPNTTEFLVSDQPSCKQDYVC